MKNHLSRLSLLRIGIAAVLLAGIAAGITAQAQRLPEDAVPSHYALTLTPDLKAATFTGAEKIDVAIPKPTQTITLNAAEIAFQQVTVTAGGATQTATVALDTEKQQAIFTFPRAVPAGPATLEIRYTGILNNELRGFYLSKTARRNYAVTQFESTDARRAFPGFDEPALKATFDVTLVVDSGDMAISNSPIVSDTPGPDAGKHTLVFSTTPKMSTYLVAFLVGDFACKTGSADGVAIRACATPDKVEMTSYALDVAEFTLHYYNNYFGIPYPLKKLDLLAIPDFEAGAMENFGAITYRETAMLIDPKTAPLYSKEQVALTVTHEMAHQWFGDLVTMDWWNNIWLNEGFASWMENKPVEAMHPEWNIPLMVAADGQGTLDLDAQPTTRSILAPLANTPDEINELFDGISYGKAGAVLLMVENYLGEETFRQGVHNYLAAHEFGNATAEDFWNAQTATSHKPVDKIMESLVKQPGEPLVSFGAPADGKVSVSQKRFFLSPSAKTDEKQQWTVPVCFDAGAAQDCQVLGPGAKSLPTPAAGLFHANAEGKGYYRSAYEPAQLKALVAAVETGLQPAERISLAGDEWAQARSGKLPVGDKLNLAAALKGDSHYEAVSEALDGIDTIYYNIASTDKDRETISAWVRKTFGPEYEKLGAPAAGDSPDKQQLRALLFGTLGWYGNDPAVLAQAREMAGKYLADPASVDPTLAQAALSLTAENGNAELFDQLQKIYETSTTPEIQETALRLLADFRDPALARRSLEYAASGKVRNQDAAFQFSIAMESPKTRGIAWEFIKNNWEKVHAQLTESTGAYLVRATGGFCSAAERDDVKSFFATHPVAAADVALRHAIEHIDGCVELRSLQQANLKQWLAGQK